MSKSCVWLDRIWPICQNVANPWILNGHLEFFVVCFCLKCSRSHDMAKKMLYKRKLLHVTIPAHRAIRIINKIVTIMVCCPLLTHKVSTGGGWFLNSLGVLSFYEVAVAGQCRSICTWRSYPSIQKVFCKTCLKLWKGVFLTLTMGWETTARKEGGPQMASSPAERSTKTRALPNIYFIKIFLKHYLCKWTAQVKMKLPCVVPQLLERWNGLVLKQMPCSNAEWQIMVKPATTLFLIDVYLWLQPGKKKKDLHCSLTTEWKQSKKG